MRRVAVFCGSSPGHDSRYAEAAQAFGRLLAASGLGVVFGGGRVGLMGLIADAALAAGGEVIGVIPQALVDREIAHHGLSDLRIVPGMHERKAEMARLSDAFIALPGGAGTLEEIFEVWTWGILGLHAKPCGLLDVDGYYAHLVAFLDGAGAAGFLRADQRAMLFVESDGELLLERCRRYAPPPAKYR